MSEARARPAPTSPAARKTMQGNRSKNTKPELELRRLLRAAGYPGYRLHWNGAPGHPDVAYPGRKVAIFVNGCFWHRCPRCKPPTPKSHSEFWKAKFSATQERDSRKIAQLEEAGWRVAIIWECELRDHADSILARVVKLL